MKKTLLFLSAFALCTTAFSQIPNYVPSNGLVGLRPKTRVLPQFLSGGVRVNLPLLKALFLSGDDCSHMFEFASAPRAIVHPGQNKHASASRQKRADNSLRFIMEIL